MLDPFDPPRTWTLAEADAVLDEVRAVVERGMAAAEGHIARIGEAQATVATRTNGHVPGGGEPAAVVAAVEELERRGILLRDPERGLVDFPARSPSGRPYWLCWLHGEPSVRWWHWVETGFAGRTSVDELPG